MPSTEAKRGNGGLSSFSNINKGFRPLFTKSIIIVLHIQTVLQKSQYSRIHSGFRNNIYYWLVCCGFCKLSANKFQHCRGSSVSQLFLSSDRQFTPQSIRERIDVECLKQDLLSMRLKKSYIYIIFSFKKKDIPSNPLNS